MTNVAAVRRAVRPTLDQLYLLAVATVIEVANRIGSPGLVNALAHGFGGLAYRVSRTKRRRMERNLTRVFGALAPAERDRIVRGAFYTFWDETMAFVPWRADATDVETSGLEHLEAARAAGKGVVLWESGFFGRRNLPKQVLRRHGFQVHQVHAVNHRAGFAGYANASWATPPRALAYFDACEREFTADILELPKSETLAAIRKLLAVLGRNEIVCITADVAKGHRLLQVPLLGEPKAFATGMVSVARTAGAALLPLFCVRERDGRLRVVIEPALPAPDGGDRDAVGDTIARYAATLEDYMRRYPDQYRSWHFPWWVSV